MKSIKRPLITVLCAICYLTSAPSKAKSLTLKSLKSLGKKKDGGMSKKEKRAFLKQICETIVQKSNQARNFDERALIEAMGIPWNCKGSTPDANFLRWMALQPRVAKGDMRFTFAYAGQIHLKKTRFKPFIATLIYDDIQNFDANAALEGYRSRFGYRDAALASVKSSIDTFKANAPKELDVILKQVDQ